MKQVDRRAAICRIDCFVFVIVKVETNLVHILTHTRQKRLRQKLKSEHC